MHIQFFFSFLWVHFYLSLQDIWQHLSIKICNISLSSLSCTSTHSLFSRSRFYLSLEDILPHLNVKVCNAPLSFFLLSCTPWFSFSSLQFVSIRLFRSYPKHLNNKICNISPSSSFSCPLKCFFFSLFLEFASVRLLRSYRNTSTMKSATLFTPAQPPTKALSPR